MVDKSALTWYNNNTVQQYGHLAQLVEHPLDVRKVSGSRPLVSTKTSTLKSLRFQGAFAYSENLKQDFVWKKEPRDRCFSYLWVFSLFLLQNKFSNARRQITSTSIIASGFCHSRRISIILIISQLIVFSIFCNCEPEFL